MKTLAPVFAILTTLIMAVAMPALAAPLRLEGDVLGTWCSNVNDETDHLLLSCTEDGTHNWVTVTPDGWHGIESSCKIINGKIIGRRSAETKTGRTNPVYKLKLRCYTEGSWSVETHTIVAFKGYLELH
jgi:hypothetical protein